MKSMILAVFRVVKGQLVKLVHMHNVLVASANLFWRISIWAHITIWVGHRHAHFVQSFHKWVLLKLCIESRRIWLGQVLGLPCPTLSSVCNIYINICVCVLIFAPSSTSGWCIQWTWWWILWTWRTWSQVPSTYPPHFQFKEFVGCFMHKK